MIVKDSLFEANGCSSEAPTASGGGVHLSFNTFNRQKLSLSQYHLSNVNFSNNCAELGGGAYFFSAHRESNEELNALLFDDCTFSRNQAHAGSAIDFNLHIFDRLANGFLLVPTFIDCRFLSNTNVWSISNRTTSGTGTVYSSQYSIKFEGHTKFFNNSGTALYMVNGLADFSAGNVTFLQNKGIRGGAVALIGLSSLLVGTDGDYLFMNNTAMDRGGAIYSLMTDKHDVSVSRSCFVQHIDSNDRNRYISISEWNANINFIGNRANAGTGHAIFATSLYPCQVVNDGTESRRFYVVKNVTDVFSVRNMTFDNDPQPQVVTEGALLYYGNDLPLQIIPGEQYNHNVILSDDLGNTVEATFHASVSNNPKVELDTAFSSCLSDEITLKGEPDQTAKLFLQTASQRQAYIELEVKLISCPPGFVLQNNQCVCNAHKYTGFLRCNTNTLHSYLSPGFWTGLVLSLIHI